MDILAFFLEESNRAFLGAFIVLLVILGLEIVSMLVGFSLSELLDNAVDFDINKPELSKPDISKPDITKPTGPISGFIGWVNAGHVPLLILIVAFLGAFSVVGYVVQWITHLIVPVLLPTLVAAPIAVAGALPIVRLTSQVVGRLFPQDHTTAVGYDSLTGFYGEVILGPATEERPGQARVRDDYGTDHYVRVVPEGQGAIEQGANVVLLERVNDDTFRVRNV